MNKIIFFDFFGVISCEVAPLWFNKRFTLEEAKLIKNEIFTLADRGDIDEEETYVRIAKRTGVDIKEIKEHWKKAPKINLELVNYIKELKKDHKIYLLSNATASYLRRILKEHNLEELFDDIFISSEFHKIKPSVDFYNYVLTKLKYEAKDCVMIDDNKENIKGAKEALLDGIIYKGVDDLKINLEKIFNK